MKISIPNPCSENWNQMSPEENGRFCLSCQKCVIDFTKMTDEEILKSINSKDLCVRVNRNQIDRINSSNSLSFTKWLKYSSFLVFIGLASTVSAQHNFELKYTTSQIEELLKKDTVITIRLQLVDDFDKIPVTGAKVYLNKRKKKYSTVTDENGFFELEIPTKYLNDYLVVKDSFKDRYYQVRDVLNKDVIGYELYLGQIDFKQNKSHSILNSIYRFFS